MGILSSERTFPLPGREVDLALVAQDLMAHFRVQGYRVAGEERLGGGWHVSLAKGNVFTSLAGMSTALKVDLVRERGAVVARTSIGIFGQQVLPTAITMLVYHPLILAQVWGAVQQYRLDDEALRAVERSLAVRGGAPGGEPSGAAAGAGAQPGGIFSGLGNLGNLGSLGNLGGLGDWWRTRTAGPPRATVQEVRPRFCISCGARLDDGVRFCPQCGTEVRAPAD